MKTRVKKFMGVFDKTESLPPVGSSEVVVPHGATLESRAGRVKCVYCRDGRALKRGQMCYICDRKKQRSRRNQA